MRIRTTLFLLIVAGLLALFILRVERQMAPVGARAVTVGAPVLDFKSEEITGLHYHLATQRVECVLQDGTWLLRHPLRAPIKPGAVDGILSHLERLKRVETISYEQRLHRGLSLEDYGLASPRARLVLVDDFGMREILVGDDSPLGKEMFVKLGSDPDVLITGRGLMELLPSDVVMLRDARLLTGTPARTVRVDVHRQDRGFLRLVRREGGWDLLQPYEAAADIKRVEAWLGELYELRVQEFIWDPPTGNAGGEVLGSDVADPAAVDRIGGGVRAEAHGLGRDEAAMRIELWIEGDPLSRELILSRERTPDKALVYAKRSNIPSIYAVNPEHLVFLATAADALRSTALFALAPVGVGKIRMRQGDLLLELVRTQDGSWQLAEPLLWKADADLVWKLLDDLLRWQVVRFDRQPDAELVKRIQQHPALTIELQAWVPTNGVGVAAPPPGDAARVKSGVLHIADYPVVGRTSFYAMYLGGDEVFEIEAKALDVLPGNPLQAAMLRDRTILRVPVQDVSGLTLRRKASEQSVVLDAAGIWSAVGTTNAVNAAVLGELLQGLAHLRAARIEAMQPESLAPFGLDQADPVLTIGLKGEQGLRKSLLLGFRAGTDGVYAHVQGQGAVFVLEGPMVELLSKGALHP